jgi:hypothetical protein
MDDPGRPLLPRTHVVRVQQAWNKPPWSNGTLDNIVVFSDLPFVELILNGKSLGSANCAEFGFAAFESVKYVDPPLFAMPALTLENDDGSTSVCIPVCENCTPAHPFTTRMSME